MEHTHLPCLNSGQAYSGQTGENPPYKGGWWKIGYHQEGGMSQKTLNPRLALRWPHLCSIPNEWGRWGCPRMSTFDHEWYWTPRFGWRQGTEMGEAAPSSGIWLTPEESAWQRLWRRQRKDNRLRAQSGWTSQRVQTQLPPIPTCVKWSFRMWLRRIPWLLGLASG